MTPRRSTALQTTFAFLALFTAAFFWGGNGVVSKILYRPDAGFDAVALFVARAVWSLPIFLALALLARPSFRPPRRDVLLIVATGICFGPGACGFLALAAQHTSGAHLVMLMSLGPAVTAAASALMLGERLDVPRTASLVVGIAGALLLALTHSATGSSLHGDLLELVQVVAYSLMFVFTRGLGTRYSPFFVSGTYGAVGMTALVIVGLVSGRLADAALQPFQSNAATLWWFFGEIIVGLSIYGQTAQAYALRTLGAGITSLLSSYGTLIFGLIGAIWLLDERLTTFGYLAAALLAVALALALMPARKPIEEEPSAVIEANVTA